ncbi:MAG TPA: NADH-quinone oxidoreductase subunit H [Acidimicrobiales bacterium]|nr:NADH-quinone oxidoreductase subunit H [Acidimicrobiales bacterium]
MITGLQPSYWQQVAAGLVVIVPTLLLGAFLLGWFARSVLEPRAAGRRWPEGARGVRPIVELVVDTQRRPAARDGTEQTDDRLEWLQAARFGLVVATCAVVPVSTGLVLTQPGLGLYVLAIALGIDALVVRAWTSHEPDAATRLWTRVGLAGALALAAGVVHAQWGSASVAAVVVAQADAAIAGVDVWGLPTLFVQPLACAMAVAACFMTIDSMTDLPAVRAGALPRVLALLVNQAWLIAISAWLVAAFAGGGAVPWNIDNPGTRQVTSIVVFATKTVLVTLALAWASAAWPAVRLRSVRALLALGAVGGVVSIGLTLLTRHLV